MNILKEIRINRKLSLRELSKLTGISHSYLWQLETGRANNPREPIKIVVSKALKIPLQQLFYENKKNGE